MKWVTVFLAISFGVIFTAAIFNYIVDPFQQYRKASFYKVCYQNDERTMNPGLAKNYDYNSIVIGSSMTENFLISDVARIMKNPIKLCMGGAVAHEIYTTLETAFESGHHIETVLIGLDIYAVAGEEDEYRSDHYFPLYLYDKHFWNDYPYLLSLDTVVLSLKALVKPYVSKNPIIFSYEHMYEWQYHNVNDFGKEKVLRQWKRDKKNFNKDFTLSRYQFSNFKKSFDANILVLVKKYPDTKFILFLPPYSYLTYEDWKEKGMTESVETFKKYLATVDREYDNLDVFDFQTAATITDNLDNYRDITHYHQKINTWMVDQIKSGNYSIQKDRR